MINAFLLHGGSTYYYTVSNVCRHCLTHWIKTTTRILHWPAASELGSLVREERRGGICSAELVVKVLLLCIPKQTSKLVEKKGKGETL